MDENNNEEMQAPKQPTKQEKAEQAGKDVAEVAAKGAANYFAGPVGGKVVDEIAKTKLGQGVLNAAGKGMTKNPLTKNALAKAQPAIQQAKPMLNAAAGSLGGSAGGTAGAADGVQNATQAVGGSNSLPTNSNPSTEPSGGTNNSGFGNNKSGLFSPFTSSSTKQSGTGSGNLGESLKKSKNTIKIAGIAASILFPMFICAIVVVGVMSQIMVVVENIEKLKQTIDTGIEKFINFAQGDGWMTNEESFFNILNEEYKNFPYTGGDELDIALIASTIHYSTTTDLEQFEENDAQETTSEQTTGTLGREQTVHFYEVAKDKLGSPNTKAWGHKRLLGYAVKTDVSLKWYTWSEREKAAAEWKELFELYQLTIKATMKDEFWEGWASAINPLTMGIKFRNIYNKMEAYLDTNGSILAGFDYARRNEYYEVQEFVYLFSNLFTSTEGIQEYEEEPADKAGLAWILAPDVKRTMNYGYDEYNSMRQDMMRMKTILSQNDINYTTDEQVLDYAKTSYDEELQKLHEDYRKNERNYMYSYTHYLQEVYIPFTYFYGKEYTGAQVEKIIDEIYDQRDFYYYLMKDGTRDNNCNGSCEYTVEGEKIDNLKVRLLQCSDGNVGQPILGEKLVNFEDYILGVVYAEVGSEAPVEVAKAQAIAARSYALTRPKEMGNAYGLKLEKESGNWILSIRNCTADQVYCDPGKGCSNTTNPQESGNSTTVYSGAETKAYKYKDPLPENSPIRSAVSSVVGRVLLDERGEIIPTTYSSTNHKEWKQQAAEGMDYTEILFSTYAHANKISTASCSNVCSKATGDYTQWKQYDEQWASIQMTLTGCGKGGNQPCTIRNIGCTSTAIAIQVARSGVPLTILELNPGTFVETLLKNGKYTPGGGIYWRGPEVVAPSFKWHGEKNLAGLTRSQKASYLQSLLNDGYYPVMEVKCDGEHWVAIDYVDGDKVYVMDPWGDNDSIWDRPSGNTNYSCSNLVEYYKIVE